MFSCLFVSSVCLADTTEVLLSKHEIAQKISEVAKTLNATYQGEELTLIMVMKGAVCVAADLMRQLHIPLTIEYINASSYGQKGTTRGELKVDGLEKLHIESKNVLVIDDIFDSGTTMSTIVDALKALSPRTIQSLVLLRKNVPREITYTPDYVLFDIDNHFVVGYGLDYKEYYRSLPDICILNLEN